MTYFEIYKFWLNKVLPLHNIPKLSKETGYDEEEIRMFIWNETLKYLVSNGNITPLEHRYIPNCVSKYFPNNFDDHLRYIYISMGIVNDGGDLYRHGLYHGKLENTKDDEIFTEEEAMDIVRISKRFDVI